MKVWLVSEVCLEDRCVLGVFSQLEKAQSFMKSLPKLDGQNSYIINKYEIDEFMKEVVK